MKRHANRAKTTHKSSKNADVGSQLEPQKQLTLPGPVKAQHPLVLLPKVDANVVRELTMPDAQAIEVVVMLLARLVNGSSTEARPVIRCTTSTRLSQIIGTALARSQLSARTLYLTNLFVHNKHFNFFVDVPLGTPVENGALYQARFLEDKPGGEEPCYLSRMEISDRPDMRAGQLGANRGGGIVSKTRYVSLTAPAEKAAIHWPSATGQAMLAITDGASTSRQVALRQQQPLVTTAQVASTSEDTEKMREAFKGLIAFSRAMEPTEFVMPQEIATKSRPATANDSIPTKKMCPTRITTSSLAIRNAGAQ